ncbi:MAG: histidine phosphatase family protein [Pseudomonadota bacterium]
MKKVILLRHAKSSWSDPNVDDHDRPLNKRGKAAAPVIAQWLAHRAHLPDTVLCSSAKRTRQTVKRMKMVLPELPDPKVDKSLYHAPPDDMRSRLVKLPKGCDTVLLVGHQPGIGALARKLSEARVRRRCARAFQHFPTAAAAVLEFDIRDWSELDYHGARFVDFAVPSELTEQDGDS